MVCVCVCVCRGGDYSEFVLVAPNPNISPVFSFAVLYHAVELVLAVIVRLHVLALATSLVLHAGQSATVAHARHAGSCTVRQIKLTGNGRPSRTSLVGTSRCWALLNTYRMAQMCLCHAWGHSMACLCRVILTTWNKQVYRLLPLPFPLLSYCRPLL